MKIATLNINGLGEQYGTWAQRRERIAASLAMLAPDVVLLQAVVHRPETGESQAGELARAGGYRYWVHESAQPDSPGVALLSRRPLDGVRSENLAWQENPEDSQRRVALFATVDWNGSALQLVNGHFSWVAALNALHAGHVMASLENQPLPFVFAGDLNATPESETLAGFAHAGWVDAWRRLRAQEAGPTFPADRPALRIDYVWVSPALGAALRHIEPFGVDSPLSDHRGLALTLAGDEEG